MRRSGNQAILALSGSWKDDPDIDEILRNIHEKRGRPMIACIALANQAKLVTRNLKHFRLVPGLKVDNWAD